MNLLSGLRRSLLPGSAPGRGLPWSAFPLPLTETSGPGLLRSWKMVSEVQSRQAAGCALGHSRIPESLVLALFAVTVAQLWSPESANIVDEDRKELRIQTSDLAVT